MTRYWHPRQTTKRGGISPPPTQWNRIGPAASSASRRYQDRIDEKVSLAGYVQLTPGLIVIYQRAPWRIVEITERPHDWDEHREALFDDAVRIWEARPRGDKPTRDTWSGRPVIVVAVPAQDPTGKPIHLQPPAHYSWQVLPEHYAICVACGELPPCRHEEADRAADAQAIRADVLMDIPPGHCLGCGEAITSRQQATRFPGPNLWRPDLPDNSAVFHARQDCAGAVVRYRTAWEGRGGTQPQAAPSFDDLGETR